MEPRGVAARTKTCRMRQQWKAKRKNAERQKECLCLAMHEPWSRTWVCIYIYIYTHAHICAYIGIPRALHGPCSLLRGKSLPGLHRFRQLLQSPFALHSKTEDLRRTAGLSALLEAALAKPWLRSVSSFGGLRMHTILSLPSCGRRDSGRICHGMAGHRALWFGELGDIAGLT